MTSDSFEIPRPLARGASTCHVLGVRPATGTMVAACGVACGNFCGEANYADGLTTCPVHAEPLCDERQAIMELFAATDQWEGEQGDPAMEGVRFTVCLKPDCPELVPIRRCWCWEHLTSCPGAGCPHAAHMCEASVHYCERHALDASL